MALVWCLDEAQHIRRGYLGRILLDDREEHLQVERGGQHRVPRCPGRHQLDVGVQQRVTDPDQLIAVISPDADQARDEPQGSLRSQW